VNIKKAISNPLPYIKRAKEIGINKCRSVVYRGSDVICELCGWHGRTFFDGKCPKCNALPRTRLVPFSLRYFELWNDGLRILHIAPNVIEYHYIKANINDISNYDRLNIRAVKHINIVQDLTKTDLKSNHYDLAIAWHVLEHIPEDHMAIAEVYRLLKPGGHFLVSVPIYPTGNLKTFEDSEIDYKDYGKIHGHFDHCRSCGLNYYKRFEAVGFGTQTLEVKTLNSADVARFGLRTDHVVWCFTK